MSKTSRSTGKQKCKAVNNALAALAKSKSNQRDLWLQKVLQIAHPQSSISTVATAWSHADAQPHALPAISNVPNQEE